MNNFTNNPIYSKDKSVAVIIPFFNGAQWVERAIQSVLNQTIKPNEFIIVNDGSSPKEKDAIELLQSKYQFQLVHKENGGQSTARNFGANISRSNYLCFLDQDDFYLPTHIEDLVNALPSRDPKFGFVYADLYVADVHGNIIFSDCVRERGPHPKRSIIDLIQRDMFVLPSASIISKEVFDKVGGFDPQFMGYEDDDLFLRIYRSGYSNYFLEKAVTVWCIHGESTSYSIKMIRSRFKYFKKLTETFPDDQSRALYFFRDCIMPRFTKPFFSEVITSIEKNTDYREEIIQMFKEYSRIVSDNPHVSKKQKIKFKTLIWILDKLPPTLFLKCFKISQTRIYKKLTFLFS